MKTINQVLVTNDYSMFQIMKGNRDINKVHLNRLKKSIQEKYIEVPIIVNERNEIIDGQHRYTSAMELGKPVYFIRIGGLKLPDVQRLNINSKNWTADSYMEGYCDLGMQDYITYRQFKKNYKLNHNECVALLSGSKRAGGSAIDAFHQGLFKVTHYNEAVAIVQKLEKIKPMYAGYKRRAFIYAMLDAFDNEKFEFDRFLHKLSFQYGKMYDCTTVDQYLMLIQEIYNYKLPKQHKVRLFDNF